MGKVLQWEGRERRGVEWSDGGGGAVGSGVLLLLKGGGRKERG